MNKKVRFITQCALIAAIYIVLTFISNAMGLASGVIQIRLSEVMTVMPLFTPAAIPGLFIGCILSNVMTGCLMWDVVFGSLATLAGALGTYYLSKKYPLTGPVYPIAANSVVIPFVLQYVYGFEGSYFYFMLTVGIGEIISCGALGILLYKVLKKHRFERIIKL